MPLSPCSDLSPAAWITGSEVPWWQLVTFGPQVFETYALLRFRPDPIEPSQGRPSGISVPQSMGEHDVLERALAVLGEHTHTPEDLYLCVWDGWGTPASLRGVPRVSLPHRSYFLLRGSLEDVAAWDSPRVVGVTSGDLPPPAFTWPADHRWCVARDVDPDYAGIGAGSEAIARLLAHPTLDVVHADPAEPPSEDGF